MSTEWGLTVSLITCLGSKSIIPTPYKLRINYLSYWYFFFSFSLLLCSLYKKLIIIRDAKDSWSNVTCYTWKGNMLGFLMAIVHQINNYLKIFSANLLSPCSLKLVFSWIRENSSPPSMLWIIENVIRIEIKYHIRVIVK